MKPKISFVTIGVTDMERALRFYRDGLGFQTHNHQAGDGGCIRLREQDARRLTPVREPPHENQAEPPPQEQPCQDKHGKFMRCARRRPL